MDFHLFSLSISYLWRAYFTTLLVISGWAVHHYEMYYIVANFGRHLAPFSRWDFLQTPNPFFKLYARLLEAHVCEYRSRIRKTQYECFTLQKSKRLFARYMILDRLYNPLNTSELWNPLCELHGARSVSVKCTLYWSMTHRVRVNYVFGLIRKTCVTFGENTGCIPQSYIITTISNENLYS